MVLVLAIGLILFIPMATNYLVDRTAERLSARANSTPIVIGTKENLTELTLSALYFSPPNFTSLQQGLVDSLTVNISGDVIPLYLRHNVRDQPIVGTVPEYFSFRSLKLAEGRMMALLGECVLGAEAAIALGAGVDDAIISTPSGAFDVAGSFPLKMKVTGILARNGSPDDQAVFTDVQTAWVISGKAHGHEDLSNTAPGNLLQNSDSSVLVASAAVLSYTEITEENRESFHFHGNPDTYPIDAIIVRPEDRKESLEIRSEFELTPEYRAVVPGSVIGDLIATLFTVNRMVALGALVIGIAAAAITFLVFALSLKLRARELLTLQKMGVAKSKIHSLFAAEIVIILTGSTVFCILLLAGIRLLEHNWIEKWIF